MKISKVQKMYINKIKIVIIIKLIDKPCTIYSLETSRYNLKVPPPPHAPP